MDIDLWNWGGVRISVFKAGE
ncbi:hypothetical protein F01_650008 [Burkholderia cenocepacia]|nr:hypothetical protein F01_650008 [Burkholderia cenocepacia]